MKDIAGQRFGKLVAIEPTDIRERECVVWRCKCDCGNEVSVSVDRLQRGRITDCGCEARQVMHRGVDLTGRRFGRLVVIEYAGSKNERRRWRCKCDCGNECVANTYLLTSGKKRSCGCLRGPSEQSAKKTASAGEPPIEKAGIRGGMRFGSLIVADEAASSSPGSIVLRCVCDCDRIVEVSADDLKGGAVTSCGECGR